MAYWSCAQSYTEGFHFGKSLSSLSFCQCQLAFVGGLRMCRDAHTKTSIFQRFDKSPAFKLNYIKLNSGVSRAKMRHAIVNGRLQVYFGHHFIVNPRISLYSNTSSVLTPQVILVSVAAIPACFESSYRN